MTQVSNDPSLWPFISFSRQVSYSEVASLAMVVYDWAMTLGQEFELIWRQRWSLMTALYLSVRYIGMPLNTVPFLLMYLPVSFTNVDCTIAQYMLDWSAIVVNAMLGVIIITRLHAMYQRSRKMLVFLSVIFLVIQFTCGVMAVMRDRLTLVEELDLSGIHMCAVEVEGNAVFLTGVSWILGSAWETLALSLAVWIAIKHFRELQQTSTGWAVGDCVTILMQTHLFYFASFVVISCLNLLYLSPKILNSHSIAIEILSEIIPIAQAVQMFVLGPRLILSIRHYQAKLVNNSDEGTAMTTIAFQEHVEASTSGGV